MLFSIYINDLGHGIDSVKIHLYADDTIVYTAAFSLKQALQQLQDAFLIMQRSLLLLKLVLNSNKTKYMIFSRGRTKVTDLTITTLNGSLIERVSSYKYLGIWVDERLAFSIHIDKLLKKLRKKLGFFYHLKNCFPYKAHKKLVESTFFINN